MHRCHGSPDHCIHIELYRATQRVSIMLEHVFCTVVVQLLRVLGHVHHTFRYSAASERTVQRSAAHFL
jgi:hypothetical protein